jgi:hypothetical protein
MDAVFLGLLVGFFLLSTALVAGCSRLGKGS